MAPNRLLKSVIAKAPCPSRAAQLTMSSMRQVESTMENSVCRRRWTNIEEHCSFPLERRRRLVLPPKLGCHLSDARSKQTGGFQITRIHFLCAGVARCLGHGASRRSQIVHITALRCLGVVVVQAGANPDATMLHGQRHEVVQAGEI